MNNKIILFLLNIILLITVVHTLNVRLQDHRTKNGILNNKVSSNLDIKNNKFRRAEFQVIPNDYDEIMGAPGHVNHLPAAEPILPGHTLLRPALGMLKSSISFPHREQDNGFGVIGNVQNLGIRYGGKQERLMYSGFRRSPGDYILISPNKLKDKSQKERFQVSTLVLDPENSDIFKERIHDEIKLVQPKLSKMTKNIKVFLINLNDKQEKNNETHHSWNWKDLFKRRQNHIVALGEDNEDAVTQENNDEDVDLSGEETSFNIMNNVNLFNHVHIRDSAPDIKDFIKPTPQQIEKWWYYNQDNFTGPYTDEE